MSDNEEATGFGGGGGGGKTKKPRAKGNMLVVDSQPNAEAGMFGKASDGVCFVLDTFKWTESAAGAKAAGVQGKTKSVSNAKGDGISIVIRPAASTGGHVVKYTAKGNAATAASGGGGCCSCITNICSGGPGSSSSSADKALTVMFSTKDINYLEMVDSTTTEQLSIGVLKCCCCKSEEVYDNIVNERKMLLHMHYGEDVVIPYTNNLTETPSTQRDCWCWVFGSNPGVDRAHSEDSMIHKDGTEIDWKQTLEKVVPSHSDELWAKICGCCCSSATDELYTTKRVKYCMASEFMNKCHEEGSNFNSLANILMLLAVEDRDKPGSSTRNAGIQGKGAL